MPSTAADGQAGLPPGAAHPPVFLAPAADLTGGATSRVVLSGQEGRHASTVRRLSPGERVDVTDGAGTVAECVVEVARPGQLELTVIASRRVPRPQPQLTVVQAIPKGDRGELAVELLTEVGADVIVPWAAQRCVAVWRGERAVKGRARWAASAVQAAKQSRRSWFPDVAEQAGRDDVVARLATAARAAVLDPDAERSVADFALPADGEIVLVVGPEGGIAPAEADAFSEAGAVPVRLGPTVLRASSAGAVAAGILLSRTGRWA